MEIQEKYKTRLFQVLVTFMVIVSAYFAIRIYSEIKKDSMLGESTTPATISFSGHGEMKATPDIANVYFTITKDAATVKDAQAGVATIEKSALDLLKTKGVADKDIKTADVSVNPKYQYKQAVCPQPAKIDGMGATSSVAPYYCPSGKQVLVGYTASESITVKVRNTDSVGDIMQGLGTTGVSNLNGPDFAIDNPDALQAQARTLAIADAKAKAKELAKELGVSLGKIESFNESGQPYPAMYNAMEKSLSGAAVPTSAPAVIPKGENTISSDVTITYEIK
jgi:uncharacterized protein YggE